MKIVDQSVELIDFMGSDLSVVNAARVSFAKEASAVGEKDEKLIAYLAKHGHWTPFAHAFLSFRIKAPIFVARQLVKHQVGLAWNEVSRRYVDDEPEFYRPPVWRKRPDASIKQGSSNEEVNLHYYDLEDTGWSMTLAEAVPEYLRALADLYKKLVAAGVAPEQARMVLPQNTMTEWIWSGSLMAFARVCKLRLDPHAQKETRDVAEMIQAAVPDDFKYSWKALLE